MTTRLVRLVLATVLIEGVCLIAFIWIGGADQGASAKLACVALGAIGVLCIMTVAARVMSSSALMRYCIAVAIGSTAFFESLAFGLYPGLAKGLDCISAAHLARTGIVLGLLAVLHVATAFAIRAATRVQRGSPNT